MSHKCSSRLIKLDKNEDYDHIEKFGPSERAKQVFRRKSYTIRGDTIGQTKTESVQSSAKGDTKT